MLSAVVKWILSRGTLASKAGGTLAVEAGSMLASKAGGTLAIKGGSTLTAEAGGTLASEARGTLCQEDESPETERDAADMVKLFTAKNNDKQQVYRKTIIVYHNLWLHNEIPEIHIVLRYAIPLCTYTQVGTTVSVILPTGVYSNTWFKCILYIYLIN